jgi:hypothetical protein
MTARLLDLLLEPPRDGRAGRARLTPRETGRPPQEPRALSLGYSAVSGELFPRSARSAAMEHITSLNSSSS